MWCIEAKAKKDIPLVCNDHSEWDSNRLKEFIRKMRTSCEEFDKALEWIGGRNYIQAVEECSNPQWLAWIQKKLPKAENVTIPEGSAITITRGRHFEYALWSSVGIFDLPEEYVGETIRVISEQ